MQRTQANERPLLRLLIGVGIALVVGNTVLIANGGTTLARVILLVWYVPLIYGFAGLAALCAAFLAFGRYQVHWEPRHFWIGLALCSYAVFAPFFVTSWPGLLPGDRAIIADLRNTVSWFFHIMFTTVAVFFLAAPVASWPRAGTRLASRWLWLVGALVVGIVSVAGLSFANESSLPLLLDGTKFSLLNVSWNLALSMAFLTGVGLSAYRYWRTGDSLLGYVAMTQLVLAFAMLAGIAAGQLYTAWWYWQGFLLVWAFCATLFGLLSEYVALYQRERERTSELKALRQKEKEERNRLQILIDAAPVGIIIHSAPSGRLKLCNKAAVAMMGRPLNSEISLAEQAGFYGISRPGGEPFPEGDGFISRALRGETSEGVEMLVRRPDGRNVNILANSTPILDADGHIGEVVTALQDVTPLKEQEKLRQEFIAAAAHELRTPVTTIKGYSQLMRKWSALGPDPRQLQAIDVIVAQCDRIDRRVHEMLAVVRIGASPSELHVVGFDLGDLVAQVSQRMQATTDLYRLLFQQDGPTPVRADPEHIEEVMVSLLDNAIKYSPRGGEIRMRVWSQDGNAVVSVTDQGVGIAKERQVNIFEPFYEAAPPGTRATAAQWL